LTTIPYFTKLYTKLIKKFILGHVALSPITVKLATIGVLGFDIIDPNQENGISGTIVISP
jgi:hypothetical protein